MCPTIFCRFGVAVCSVVFDTVTDLDKVCPGFIINRCLDHCITRIIDCSIQNIYFQRFQCDFLSECICYIIVFCRCCTIFCLRCQIAVHPVCGRTKFSCILTVWRSANVCFKQIHSPDLIVCHFKFAQAEGNIRTSVVDQADVTCTLCRCAICPLFLIQGSLQSQFVSSVAFCIDGCDRMDTVKFQSDVLSGFQGYIVSCIDFGNFIPISYFPVLIVCIGVIHNIAGYFCFFSTNRELVKFNPVVTVFIVYQSDITCRCTF